MRVSAGYDQTRALNVYRAIEEKLAALPGVERASISSTVPFGMISLSKSVQRAGVNPPPDSKPATAADGLAFDARWNSVGAEYFSTVGMPVLRGRAFNAAEAMHESTAKVAIIDEVLAKKLWPDGDALGQQIQFAAKDAPKAKSGGNGGAGQFEEGRRHGQGADRNCRDRSAHAPEFVRERSVAAEFIVPFAGGFQSNVFFHIKFAPGAARDARRRRI